MTKPDLNKLIAERLLGMKECAGWHLVYYRGQGAALLKNCTHQDGQCYSERRVQTLLGIIGGPPQYCESSRAGLQLLRELSKRADNVILHSSGTGLWSIRLIKWEHSEPEDGQQAMHEVTLAGPCEAKTPELAIGLAAAELAGVKLSAGDITE